MDGEERGRGKDVTRLGLGFGGCEVRCVCSGESGKTQSWTVTAVSLGAGLSGLWMTEVTSPARSPRAYVIQWGHRLDKKEVFSGLSHDMH